VRDAMAVGDNQRRAIVGFSLYEGFQRMFGPNRRCDTVTAPAFFDS
jgi:hypothetical protein